MGEPSTRVARRHLLSGGAAGAAGLALGWGGATWAASPTESGRGTAPGGQADATVPFHGRHQAGVETPPQQRITLLGLDLRDGVDQEGLRRLMLLLSDDAARLTQARPSLGDQEPELAARADRLTVTFGFGPRVFAEVLRARPDGAVRPLPPFATDRLERRWGQTDLVVQIGADQPMPLAHARKVLLRDARSFVAVRWEQEGFRAPIDPAGGGQIQRNLMGQVDGISNVQPGSAEFEERVWIGGSGPLAGGSQLVVRRIAMDLDGWEKVDRAGREATVGRTHGSGAPLAGHGQSEEPDLEATDKLGFPLIDPASHMARARSTDRTERIFRRGYNYDVLADGEPQSGLLFLAFQSDVDRQFVPIQRRLAAEDRLNAWVTSIGSAAYSVLPGCRPSGFVGDTLLGDAG